MIKPNPPGIYCPKHPTAKLFVVNVRKVAVGIVVRYHECSECRARVKTEERTRPIRPICRKVTV